MVEREMFVYEMSKNEIFLKFTRKTNFKVFPLISTDKNKSYGNTIIRTIFFP